MMVLAEVLQRALQVSRLGVRGIQAEPALPRGRAGVVAMTFGTVISLE